MTTLKAWDGKEWQKYIEELLVLHYGPEDFQRIPDECQGDLGLEAFTRSGNGIQCYAPQGRLTIKQRYEKHRIKLSVDLSKLMQNQDGLRAVLGQTVLKRCFFIIPEHDNKQLIVFANKKSREVCAKCLSYIAPDFEIQIHDDASFPAARNKLLGISDVAIALDIPQAEPTQIQDWAAENDTLIQIVDGKLARLSTLTSRKRRIEFRNLLVARSIEGENILEQIRMISPDCYERIIEIKSARASSLAMENYTSTIDPSDRLNAVVTDYMARLRNDVRVLPPGADTILGYEAISEWLAQCNLDFPEGGDV
jgi:hypothetical protein